MTERNLIMAASAGQQSLTVGRALAEARFVEAYALATSDAQLPDEWIIRTKRLDKATSRTFTPALGTALLAKATNRLVTALALQSKNVHRGYSARGLAKSVLVPMCVRHKIDLRTTGAEPLNNQPFFSEPIITKELIPIGKPGREDLEYLVECLERADYLEDQDAVDAFAAFLRARIEVGQRASVLTINVGVLPVPALRDVATQFININREGGRRGQAFVAACLDLVHPGHVRADAINDPSRRVPGDVAIEIDMADGEASSVVLSAEAKQKAVSQSEILQFVERLAKVGIGKGLYAAVHPTQPDLHIEQLVEEAQDRNGILLGIITDPGDLLTQCLQWSQLHLNDALETFPQLMAQRLIDFNCGQESQAQWSAMLTAARAPEPEQ